MKKFLLRYTSWKLSGIASQSLMQDDSDGDEESIARSYSSDPENLASETRKTLTVMEKQGEIEKGKANNFAVSFSALRKDVVNVLDFMERLKNEKGQNAVDIADQLEKLKLVLAFICMYIQLSYLDLDKFEVVMTAKRQRIEELLRSIVYDGDSSTGSKSDMDHVLPRFMENIDDCISLCHHSMSGTTMTEEQLNFLLVNLHHLSKHQYLEEQMPSLVTQYEILQNLRELLFLWDELILENSSVFKLAHLLMNIFSIELEVMNVCFTNLKASTSAEVGLFIKQLLESSPDIFREYLIHLQEHMVTVITASTSGARNIHVMKEFLLIVLTDMPKDFIHHDKLFDLLARVGALIRELFMHLLLIHLNDMLDSNSYSIALMKEEITLVKEALEFIRSFFVNVEQGLYKDLWSRVLDVAYEAKDVIDSIILSDNGLLHPIFSLPKTIKKTNIIKEDVSNLGEKIPMNKSLIVVNSPKNPVERKLLTTGKIIVGFKVETNWLIRKLTSGPTNLDVISITGMPGSGKTTLAYKVYNDKSVCSHFDLRAWCTVDQDYDDKNLLVKLFNQVTGSDLKFSEEIDVADKLRIKLHGNRYLIVLDDVWDVDTWDDLTRPFPEVKKGSKIILTTWQKEVAFHGRGNTDPLNLRLLRPEESWELLEKRAFGEQSCPDELLDVGKEIAQNCKGLPLVADLIAGVIARREKTKSVWLEVRNNLNSFILNSEVDVMKVIELSYDHLPLQLKLCYLYIVRFSKDTRIQIHALKSYWCVEGLVEQTEMMSVEEAMEIYLDNLISSSLISSSDPSSSSYLMPRIVTIVYDKEHFGPNNFILFSTKTKRHSGKHLYSLRITGDKMEDHLSDGCHLRDLRILRVLFLHPSFMMVKDSLLSEICMLNHLRFLGIGTEVKSLPSSFSNLRNLETLVVSNEGSTWVLLPSIWDLVNLRVLKVTACSFFDLDIHEPIPITEDTKLENLRQLGKLVLSYSKEMEDIFKSSKANDSGPSLATNWSWDFHFPSNLKEVSLWDFPQTSDSLSTIARLSDLEVLTLGRSIIQGEEWNMGEEETFVNLKCLYLEEVTLGKWEFGEESFPMLEKLVLWKCHMLKEIPPSFGDICSLKIIKLVHSPKLEDSAKKIKQYVEDMGGAELQVPGPNNIPLFK
ncbi:hypothetical protein BC332_14583 [Capsicum chinense]|nr:hypothetical protein BC332_14583 [Capsicum chinense]